MASEHFQYTPTSGNGDAEIEIYANAENQTHGDHTARITFTNGTLTATANIRQKYCPYFIQSGEYIPQSGGSVSIVVHTEYSIQFRNIPAWITISWSGGRAYTEGTVITASQASGSTFTITASENQRMSSRNTSGMCMSHIVDGNYYDDNIYVEQEGVESVKEIMVYPATMLFDYISGQSQTVTVTTRGVNTVRVRNLPTDYTIMPVSGASGMVITGITDTTNNTGARMTASFTVADPNGEASAKTVSIIQKYKPYIYQVTSIIPASGGTKTVSVYSEYDIVFNNVPAWVTISSGSTTYSGGQRITVSELGTLPATFTLTAAQNMGPGRDSSGFTMCHYMGETLITTGVPEIFVLQAASDDFKYVSIPVEVYNNGVSSGARFRHTTTIESEYSYASTETTVTNSTPPLPAKIAEYNMGAYVMKDGTSNIDITFRVQSIFPRGSVTVTLTYGNLIETKTFTPDGNVFINVPYLENTTLVIEIDQ